MNGMDSFRITNSLRVDRERNRKAEVLFAFNLLIYVEEDWFNRTVGHYFLSIEGKLASFFPGH